MKKGLTSILCASALLGATSLSFAGAYGEAEKPEELPTAPPAATIAPEPEPEPAPAARISREFAGFETDAETARGLWAEIGSLYNSETDLGPDTDGVYSYARLAYGQEMWEVGAKLPYLWLDFDHGPSDDALGNLSFYGKVVPIRTEMFTLGGGLLIAAPTGGNLFGASVSYETLANQIVSTDDWGFNPFVTGSVAAGPASIRATIGYLNYEGVSSDDALTYNAAVLLPVGETVTLRGEFIGTHYFDLPIDLDPVSFVPGVDIAVPLGGWDLIVRPTGGVGLTDETPDWQLGLGLALAQSAS